MRIKNTFKIIEKMDIDSKSKSRKINVYMDNADPYTHRIIDHYHFLFKTPNSKTPYEASYHMTEIYWDRSNPDHKTNTRTSYQPTKYIEDVKLARKLYKELTSDLNKPVVEIYNYKNHYDVKLDNDGDVILNPDYKNITIFK